MHFTANLWRHTMKRNYGTYATAIALATIGATVSLSGLVAMFGLAFLPIGLGLEVAKLVAARRIHQGHLTTAFAPRCSHLLQCAWR
jgi:hypothetical protein